MGQKRAASGAGLLSASVAHVQPVLFEKSVSGDEEQGGECKWWHDGGG